MVKVKKLKTRIKNSLILKIAKLRKQNKHLKNKIEELILKEQEYIDLKNVLQAEVRRLKLENERLTNKKE